jgi:predicted ATPase
MHIPPYPLIEGFWIRNYKAFRQIAIGSCFQQSIMMDFSGEIVPYKLSPFTLVAGDSGTGKSTMLDVFAFLADCINHGINEALNRRGGFGAVYHFGGKGPISLGVVYRPCAEPRSLAYMLNIDRDKKNRPFVETEAIVYRDHQPGSQPRPILLFQNGEKRTRLLQPWVGASESVLTQVKQTDSLHLGLTALSQFEDLPDVPQFKLYLDKFFVSHYIASNATGLSPSQFKIAPKGNLALDLKRIKDKHPAEFAAIWDVIAKRLPGIEKVDFEQTESGRLVLSFKVAGHDTPVYPAQLGEGTLRLLSHLTLFEDPVPTPLVGIEEPAAFMGYSQIVALVELVQHHVRELGGTQFLATTNSNTLIDQMDPTEVWFLMRNNHGEIHASRGLDELQFLGTDLSTVGPYWYSQYLYIEQKTNSGMGSRIQQPISSPGT